MKLIKTITSCILLLLLIGCSQQKKEEEYCILSGTFDNAADNYLVISKILGDPIDTISINAETGKFKDTLYLPEGHYYIQSDINGMWIYLPKGNEVNFQVDLDSVFDSIECTKDDTGINQYLALKYRNKYGLLRKYKPHYNKTEQEFKTAVSNIKEAKDSMLLATTLLLESYRKQEERNIYYEYLNELKGYIETASFNKQKISSEFSSELEHENLDDIDTTAYFFSDVYKSLILWNIEKKARALAEKDSIDIPLATITIINQVQDQQVKNNLAHQKAIIYKGMVLTKNHKAYYTMFKETSNDTRAIQKVTTLYERLQKTQKGSLSPKFNGYENYAGGTVSLDDLKGKYVYIDVWATWCGPCVKEVPHLKKRITEYEGKNIEFVSISVDKRKDYEKWRAMVEKDEMEGIQLFADNAFDSSFAKEYSIASIPRFIFLDPEGNIISSNAPRPSDPKLIALFDSMDM